MVRGVRRVLVTSCLVAGSVSLALQPGAASARAAAPFAGGGTTAAQQALSAVPAPGPAAGTPDRSAPSPSPFARLTPRRAVTHGSAVASPSRVTPWAVSLWLEAPTVNGLRGDGTLHFLCSATAISGRLLVTAAHCTEEPGFLYVRVGVDSFSAAGGFIPVEAVRAHRGYGELDNRDDIAMLQPLFDLGLRSYARLGTAAIARAVRAGDRALTLYGWGDTETGKLTGQLRSTAVQQQQAVATKAFGRVFVPTRMIAAGRLDPATKRYAGGCSGDSGGPLTTRVASVTYLVGVTDFGAAAACDSSPTVFASVGDYTAWESQSKALLPGLARTHNTALPVAMSVPTVTGSVALGRTVTCASGAWSSNATQVDALWLRGEDSLGVGSDHVIAVADAGQTLVCVSVARSHAGYDAATVPTPILVPALPAASGAPTFTGVTDRVRPILDSVATCSGVTPTTPDASTAYDWLNASVADGSDGVVIATGQMITFGGPTLDALAGRFLICRATTSNVMGAVVSTAYAAIPTREPAVAASPAASSAP